MYIQEEMQSVKRNTHWESMAQIKNKILVKVQKN